MKTLIGLSSRTIAVGAIALFLAACANSNVPGSPSGASVASKVKPATACGSGILVGAGNNGTYSVAIGKTCDLTGPDDVSCLVSSLTGELYTFTLQSGASFGTFTPSGNTATFKRTSAGTVVIELRRATQNPVDHCTGAPLEYGTVTLD
jgi:hypothetical protein